MSISYQSALSYLRTASIEVFKVGVHTPGVMLQVAAGAGVIAIAGKSLGYLANTVRSNVGFIDSVAKKVEGVADSYTPQCCKDVFNKVVGFAQPYNGLKAKDLVALTVGAWAAGAVWHDLAIKFIGQPSHTFNLFGQFTGLRVSGDSIINNVSQLVSSTSKLVFGTTTATV